ncbi:MFS transporter [Candidatus Bathyarchaeota archaeon]|nr:MFS transporter [Candidatus Bathyarchaeota archaeon]MBT4320262.1 MFS transporter [Candidatus Bathyarchaeota archaeon]MBT6604881.1 MFS transporter [Candidatus Bathyarchaeota archaeon]MBT7187136.1 MFS transporter [Candidatus Bathyarchaeota archaeon]
MAEKNWKKTLIFYALGVSMASGGPPAVSLSLLLIDIAESINVPVATLGQISSFSSFLSIFMAINMGVLSVRYSHKLLLSSGLLLMCFSILGTSLSSNFSSIFLSYSFVGIGYSMVMPMVTTYIGELYPPEGRTKVMGQLIAVRSIVSFIAPLLTGYILTQSTWRIAYSSFNLSTLVLSLGLVFWAIPANDRQQKSESNLLAGIRAVFRNRSALAFLLAGALGITPFIAISVYNGSYLRQVFNLSVETVSQLMPLTAISVTVGLLISNRLVESFGLKKVVYLSTLVSALSYLVYFGAGLSLVPSVVFSLFGAVMTGIRLASSSALGLLQEKVYRGSMMSLSSASQGLGGVLGALIGGLALSNFGYYGLGALTSFFGVASFAIYLLWVNNKG